MACLVGAGLAPPGRPKGRPYKSGLLRPVTRSSLFVAQGDHGIDPHRPPRGDVAGHKHRGSCVANGFHGIYFDPRSRCHVSNGHRDDNHRKRDRN